MKEEKGMYSTPFEKRRKQLATIQAAERLAVIDDKTKEKILPTVEKIAKAMSLTYDCVSERVKKLRKAGIVITRNIDDAERIERSLRSRRAR